MEKKHFKDLIDNCCGMSGRSFSIEESTRHDFSPAGKVYRFQRDDMEGLFWVYECAFFSIDIHQFQIHEESFNRSPDDLKTYGEIFSTYVVKGSGETFHPYQNLHPGSLFTTRTTGSAINYLLHKNTPFVSVEICFKKPFIKKYMDVDTDQLSTMFIRTEKSSAEKIGRLARDIMHCTMRPPAADIFFEAKASEWLSIIMDDYARQSQTLPLRDSEALSNVARYINDHYAMTISQKTLENISMMSGTRLKTSFKKKYGCTITEYTQRQRIRVAETLLLNTSLSIGDVAKAVGYRSQSRFSQIFKRYTHLTPGSLRNKKAPDSF